MTESMIKIKFGIKKLHHRMYGILLTGDEVADMIIQDLTRKVNENADEIERLEKQIEEQRPRLRKV